MVDLVKQWKEAARRDDLFNHMVPSDVRQLVGEIERLGEVIREIARIVENPDSRAPRQVRDITDKESMRSV